MGSTVGRMEQSLQGTIGNRRTHCKKWAGEACYAYLHDTSTCTHARPLRSTPIYSYRRNASANDSRGQSESLNSRDSEPTRTSSIDSFYGKSELYEAGPS